MTMRGASLFPLTAGGGDEPIGGVTTSAKVSGVYITPAAADTTVVLKSKGAAVVTLFVKASAKSEPFLFDPPITLDPPIASLVGAAATASIAWGA